MRDVGDEMPVLPLPPLTAPLQIRAARDIQYLQSGEAFNPLCQGSDARAVDDPKLFKGGESAHRFRNGSQARQVPYPKFP
jgi:hypothetical protein